MNFNFEIVMTNNGDLDEIKKYCSTHICREEKYEAFMDRGKEQCKSFRDGKCMMLEFIKTKGE